MRASVLLILILFCVVAGTLSYHFKFRAKEGDIDKLSRAISGIKGFLPRGSVISLVTGDVAVRSQSRFILAPDVILADGRDTALVIYGAHDTAASPRNVIWQYSDEKHKYYLITGAQR